MTRTLRIDASASEELAAAVRWYDERRPGLGADFFRTVNSAIALIESHPEMGSPLSTDQRTRRLVVQGFPYHVVYRLGPSAIVIVAFAHMKRRPGFWKTRY